MFEFKLPDLGEGIHEGQIVNVLVKEGETIEEFAPMLEVETDKAAVEIPSPKSGVVSKVNVKAGDNVKVGQVMLVIDTGAAAAAKPAAAKADAAPAAKPAAAPAKAEAAASSPPPAAPARPAATAVAAPPPPAPAARRDGPVPAAPVVRKLAREMGVDLNAIQGSGPHGRVVKEDVERYAMGHRGGAAAPAYAEVGGDQPLPAIGAEALPDFSQYGPVRREAVPQIRKTIARQMTRAWLSVPRVTHGEEIDITDIERNRKRYNEKLKDGQAKLSVTAIVMKAVAVAIQDYPKFNCSFDATTNEIIYKDYVNLGVAVDGPRGLVVPVVKDCHIKTLPQIAADLNGIAAKVRDNKIEISDLRGATFTVTNVGALGGTFATPMVNYPEVAILGMAKAALKPTVHHNEIVPRFILPLFMSFDHRVIDGADAARFCTELKDMLENPLRLLGA